jgi:DNA-binding response OmpR family regulator
MNLLIIEDDDSIRMTLEWLMRELGANTSSAASIDQAKEKMDGKNFDVIFLDILLNGEYGFELIDYARKKFKQVRIIVLTALSNGENLVSPYKPDYFLAKPFDISILENIFNNCN